MNITKSTTTVTCPHCGSTSTYDLTLHELADGRTLICSKCGRDIVIDRHIFEKVEDLLENPPAANLFATTTATNSSMSFVCLQCGKTTTTTDMTLSRLVDGERVFCIHCGYEIPVDPAKIRQAEGALRGLAVSSEGTTAGSLDTSEGPVTVKTKTFSFDIKTDFNVGGKKLPGSAEPAGGTPIITPRRTIEPKSGCLGVMAVLILVTITALIYGLFA